MLRRSSRLWDLGYYRTDGTPTVTYSDRKFRKVKVLPLAFPSETDSQSGSDAEEIREQPRVKVQENATNTGSNSDTAADAQPENTAAETSHVKTGDGWNTVRNVYVTTGCTLLLLSFLSLGVIQCRQIQMQIRDTQQDLLSVKMHLKLLQSVTVKELQQELESAEEQHTKSMKELQQELESAEERHTKSVKELQQELESAEERHTNSVKELQQELESVEERHTKSVKEVQQELESAEERHTKSMKELQQELESAEERHTKSVKELQQELESAEERHTNSVKELQQELESVEERHTKSVKEVQQELESVEERHTKSVKEVQQELESVEERHTKSVKELQQELESAEERHTKSVKEVQQELKSAEEHHTNSVKEVQQELESAEERHTNSVKELQKELESVEERHTNSVKELQKELESAEERHTNSVKELQQELESAEERQTNSVKELQQELESVTKRLALSAEELQEAFQSVKKLVKALTPVADSMPNYALESQGARVLHHLSSAALCPQSKGRMWERVKSYLDSPAKQHRVIEGKSSLYPGDCWAFAGEAGHLFIALTNPVHVTHVTLGHITRSQSSIGDIPSAPRQFSVYGMRTEKEEGTHLGRFVYDRDGEAFQTFDLPDPSKDHIIRYVKLQIEDNWGSVDFTCLYNFRVHGKLPAAHNATASD